MRVEAVELGQVRIAFKRAFAHARHERRHADLVIVKVIGRDPDVVGWGECLPRPYVTGETLDEVLRTHGPALADRLLGETFADFPAATEWLEAAAADAGRTLATLAGFDLAVLDAVGRSLGVSVAEALGGVRRDPLPAGVIVGFEIPTDRVARYCAALRLAGKTHVKVKVGHVDDLERLRAVATVFKDRPVRIDANAAWSVEEAIDRLRDLSRVIPIASVEQPVAAADLDGMRRVREATGLRVMADESVCSLEDARRVVDARAADVLNVRLGKNGGLWASRKLVELAEQAALDVHLGTMVGETGVASAASEIFGRCIGADGTFDCLDGKGQSAFLLEVDILTDSGQDAGPDVLGPGLGVTVDPRRVADHLVGEPHRRTH
jgi:L-Ala-D/L-Glu epimerase